MIDPAAYDDAESLAYRASGSWTWRGLMSGSVLDYSNFPVRVRSIHDLKPLINAMDQMRYEHHLREIGGLREDDLVALSAVTKALARFFIHTFHDPNVIIPLGSLVSHLLVFRKISALPRRERMLEIGGGSGFLPLFTAKADGFGHRNQIEVTQSFYVLQSLLNSHLFGIRFSDRAVDAPPPAPIEALARSAGIITAGFEPTARLGFDVSPAMTQYPWWKVNEAFDPERPYDVAVSNANVYEMTLDAFILYFSNLSKCLAPEGVVLFQEVGATGRSQGVDRLAMLLDYGFRPLVNADRGTGERPLSCDNVVLVKDTHPHWNDTAQDFSTQHFPTDVPLVRAMFGLDRPAGSNLPRHDLLKRFVASFQAMGQG